MPLTILFCIRHYLQLLSEKTPLSGPGALKTRAGRKRNRNEAGSNRNEEMESLEFEYRGEWERFGSGSFDNLPLI